MSIESYELKIAQIAKSHLPELGVVDNEFKSFIKGLPSDISQNGLLQTLTFIKGKETQGNEPSKYDILFNLFQKFFNKHFSEGNLLDILPNLESMSTYLFYQRGFLVYASWLKRLVLALD